MILLCGAIFVAAGLVMRWKPPRRINHVYGYRTARSMADQESWDFAQAFSARELVHWGAILLAAGLAVAWLEPRFWIGISAAVGLLVLACVGLLLRTEGALRRRGTDDARPGSREGV